MENNTRSFFYKNSKLVILLINVIFASVFVTFSFLYNPYIKFQIAESNHDLRYIEHAEQLICHLYLEPVTNSINPPIYPLFLFFLSFVFDLSPGNIMLFQWLILSIVLTFLSTELFHRHRSFLVLMSIYFFSYFNPIFFEMNDGGVFPEFFTVIILFLVITLWFRYSRNRSLFSLIFLSFFSGVLILTRYEFVILGALLFLDFCRSKTPLHTIVFMAFPVVLLSINGLKNKLIFNEFRLLSYSANETKFGGVTADGSWHNIDSSNVNQIIPLKYVDEFVFINSDTNFVRKIIRRDELFDRIYMEEWESDFSRIIKMVPCKIMKLFIPPPTVDAYTCCPKSNCYFTLDDYFGDVNFFEQQNLFPMAIEFFFHLILLLLALISIFFSSFNFLTSPFSLFVICQALMLVLIFYGLSRFCFNFYPVLIIMQSSLFVRNREGNFL